MKLTNNATIFEFAVVRSASIWVGVTCSEMNGACWRMLEGLFAKLAGKGPLARVATHVLRERAVFDLLTTHLADDRPYTSLLLLSILNKGREKKRKK